MIRKLVILLLLPTAVLGQTEKMHKTPRNYQKTPNWGPNRAHHVQGLIGFGLFMPFGVSARDFKIGTSTDFHLGAVYRYRASKFFNLGAGIYLSSSQIELNDSGMVKGWDGEVHKKAQLLNYTLTLKPFIRLNLSPKRGDYLGTYLDFGGFGSWGFLPTTSFTDKVGGQKLMLRYINDKQHESFYYGAMAAVGRDWFRLEASYYLSDWLKGPANFNLPKYSVSVFFGF